MHDMAITKNYSILLEFPLFLRFRELDQNELLKSTGGWVFEGTMPTRIGNKSKLTETAMLLLLFLSTVPLVAPLPCLNLVTPHTGVLRRHAYDDENIRWFDCEPCFAFHVANAWESDDGNSITILMMSTERMDFQFDKAAPTYLTQFVIDLKKKPESQSQLIPRTVLSYVKGEFPVIHPELQGYQTRYIYFSRVVPPAPGMMDAVVKYDAKTGTTEIHKFADSQCGGEMVFIPSRGNDKTEDDGYLVGFTHNETTNISEFYIIDAKTMSEIPLARIVLPERVPYGFHGTWIPSEELNHQHLSTKL